MEEAKKFYSNTPERTGNDHRHQHQHIGEDATRVVIVPRREYKRQVEPSVYWINRGFLIVDKTNRLALSWVEEIFYVHALFRASLSPERPAKNELKNRGGNCT